MSAWLSSQFSFIEQRALHAPLREVYHARGVQIIIKMASIQLTPEKPEFPAGGWHTEDLLNERICATALYYLDSQNITESSLSFRMHTSANRRSLRHAWGSI